MRRIGKYAICGLLGRGGMGLVYKVRVPIVDKIVALKLCRPNPRPPGPQGQGSHCPGIHP